MQRNSAERATLSTVAERAGVSRQTVSNALNNPELLKSDTLARVLAIVEELGYRPNRAARQLRTQNSHLIGLRINPDDSALLDRFLHSLVEASEVTGHHVVLFTGAPGDRLDGYDEVLASTDVDAFVITDTYASTPQVEFLRSSGVPFVTFGRPWRDAAATHPWVDVDGAHGVELATRHLTDQGHEVVGWLGWEDECYIGEDRRSGWETALVARGLSGPTGYAGQAVDKAVPAALKLIDDGATAIACATDTLALGVLHACAERGLVPGRDIGVTGFDDSLPAQVVWPGLTSVRQPLEEVAREVVDLLTAVLNGESSPQQGRLLRPTLVERGSSLRRR